MRNEMRVQLEDKYRFMALIMMKDHTLWQRIVLTSSVEAGPTSFIYN